MTFELDPLLQERGPDFGPHEYVRPADDDPVPGIRCRFPACGEYKNADIHQEVQR